MFWTQAASLFSPQMSQNMQLTLANKSETTPFLCYCKTRDRQITTALLVALFISINKRSNLHKEFYVRKFQQRRTKHATPSNDMDFHCAICLSGNVSLSCLGAFISSFNIQCESVKSLLLLSDCHWQEGLSLCGRTDCRLGHKILAKARRKLLWQSG